MLHCADMYVVWNITFLGGKQSLGMMENSEAENTENLQPLMQRPITMLQSIFTW